MISVDNVTNSGTQTSSASYSYSHTCTTNAGILIVGVAIHDAVGLTPTASAASLTYNGVALTAAVQDNANLSAFGYAGIFYLLNPAAGSNTLAVTLDQAYNKSIVGAISLAGAVTGLDNTASFNAASTNITNSITPVAGKTIVVDVLVTHGQTPTGPNTGQILVYSGAFGTSGGLMSYRPGVPPNSTSMGWTNAIGPQYDQVLASFAGTSPSVVVPKLKPHPFSPGIAR